MKISVIMATYNGEAFIVEQLISLFHQTRLPDEILIGDDSSNWNTIEEINRIKDQFSGELRVIRNPVRLGIVKNYRNLASLATGDIIFFADQDDFWLPEKIEKMVGALKKHPEKMVVVCNSKLSDRNLEPQNELLLDRTPEFQRLTFLLEQGDGKSFKDIFMQKFNFPAHNMAMRKEIRDLFLQVPDDYLYHDLWLAQISCLAGKLFYLDEPLTLFRQHGSNSSGQLIKRKNKIREIISSFSHSTDEIEKTWLRLNTFSQVAEKEKRLHFFPEENLNELRVFTEYFRKRVELHKRILIVRFIYVLPLWTQYFRYGFGFRSLLRDLIIK